MSNGAVHDEEEEDEGEETLLTLAQQIKAIDYNNWYNLLDKLFTFVLQYMRCIQVGEICLFYYCCCYRKLCRKFQQFV